MIHNTKTKVALTGGAAAAEVLRQTNPDVAAAYPITPQTPIIETFAQIKADGKVDTEIIMVESEHSAMSACVGASAAGARTVTATSSQGLALMNEILYIASGMHLPILMFVSARALSAPINIHGDHSDVMGARDTGWIQIFCENSQEVYDLGLIGLKLAETAQMPIMVIMDGFTTSHSVDVLETLPDETVKKFTGEYQNAENLFNFENPPTFGPVGLPDSYFEFKAFQVEALNKVPAYYQRIAKEYKEISGRDYAYFEGYKLEDADKAMVIAGSTAGTAKDVVDKMRERGEKVGLLEITMWRPFPRLEIKKALAGAKHVAVMDRALSFGSLPPITSEIIGTIGRERVTSYVYGLGGRDIFAKNIEKVFEEIGKESHDNFKYIGLK